MIINSKYKNIKAILFDCDGVICKPYKFAEILANKHNITITMTKDFFKNIFPDCAINKRNVLDVLPTYLKTWGWSGDVNSFLALWLESEKNTEQDVIEIIENVKALGFKTGLATNQEIHRAKYMRDVMKLNNIFDELFISSELQAMKPYEEYFETITKKLAINPNEILFIDDQQKYLDAAHNYGWHILQFQTAAGLKNELFI